MYVISAAQVTSLQAAHFIDGQRLIVPGRSCSCLTGHTPRQEIHAVYQATTHQQEMQRQEEAGALQPRGKAHSPSSHTAGAVGKKTSGLIACSSRAHLYSRQCRSQEGISAAAAACALCACCAESASCSSRRSSSSGPAGRQRDSLVITCLWHGANIADTAAAQHLKHVSLDKLFNRNRQAAAL